MSCGSRALQSTYPARTWHLRCIHGRKYGWSEINVHVCIRLTISTRQLVRMSRKHMACSSRRARARVFHLEISSALTYVKAFINRGLLYLQLKDFANALLDFIEAEKCTSIDDHQWVILNPEFFFQDLEGPGTSCQVKLYIACNSMS